MTQEQQEEQRPPGRYRIQAMERFTGVSAATLRAWERRYGVPSPGRGDNRYRLYDDDDLLLVQRMVQLTHRGLGAAEAARQALEESRLPLPGPTPPAAGGASPTLPAAARALVDAAVAMDLQGLEDAVRDGLARGEPWLVYRELFVPALRAIGEGWASGRLGVAHEHLASQVIGLALREQLQRVELPQEAPHLLLASLAGELHELELDGGGLEAAALGWRTTLLGSRTPPEALADAVWRLEPAAVGLSVMVPVLDADPRVLFAGYSPAVGRTPWILGGGAAAQYRGVVHALGGVVAAGEDALGEFLGRIAPSARRTTEPFAPVR